MVELLCTLTGVIAGVAAVASLLHQQDKRMRFQSRDNQAEQEDRIRGIAEQLQVISHRVAANVTAHNERVEHINGRLSDAADGEPEQIISTIHEIIECNQLMQGQLADAQKRISQQTQLIEQVSHQARTDALTGLANRRALDEFVGNCLKNLTDNEAVGLLLMDIDHFKSFNDSFGHNTGDAVLASFARAIAEVGGQGCFAARYGGEEFAVVMVGASLQELSRHAAEIRHFVSEQVISYQDLQLKITSSGGLCALLPGDNVTAAYERADEGLYQSKNAGRNCGFWLSESGWLPFPEVHDTPDSIAKEASRKMTGSLDNAAPLAEKQLVEEPRVESMSIGIQLGELDEDDLKPVNVEKGADNPPPDAPLLDLNDFLKAFSTQLAQLRRASLPSALVMVEVNGLSQLPASVAATGWEAVVDVVRQSLHDDDVLGLFRPFTLCVSLPRCALDEAVERAARLQARLSTARASLDASVAPDRFAVAVGVITEEDEPATFMDRMEAAVEEAADGATEDFVVHDGEASYFHFASQQ